MDYKQQKRKWKVRDRKSMGVRRRLNVGGDRPRLSVFRSSKHISVQLIDDLKGVTLVAASDMESGLSELIAGKTKSERAAVVGATIAERAKEAGVSEVKFDRGRFLFHGRVKALAEAAREGGLKF